MQRLRPLLTRPLGCRPVIISNSSITRITKRTVMSSLIDGVKSTIAENFGGKAHSVASEEHQFALEEVPDLSGKVAVVTGGSQGIGYGCTHTMLSKNIKHVFIMSMSGEVVDDALKAIGQEMGEEAAKKVTWLPCDISNWLEVKATADKIASKTDRIDILICNAGRGIMTYQLTDYGVDRHMALNVP